MPDILAINTGGTMSMADGPHGRAPKAGLVETAFAELAPAGVRLNVISFDPLVDSADIGADHWNQLIDLIVSQGKDGVIIAHGTDTMPFTGAALSFALEGIGIPVILVGAMHPLGTGQGTEDHLRFALQMAASGLSGVWLAFGGKLMNARRLVKHHSKGPDSFRETQEEGRQEAAPFHPCRFLPRRLAILTVSPGLGVSALDAALRQLDGAVIRVFGTGTLMNDPQLFRTLSEATGRGCRIVAVSACENGGLVPGAYAADVSLWKSGVEKGGALTPEAALTRLWLELSEPSLAAHR